MFVASGVGPYSGQSVHFRNYAPEKIQYAINRYMYEAQRHFGILDARLAKQKYMVGDTYTMSTWRCGAGRGSFRTRSAGTLGQVPQPEAAGRRDFRPACGGAREALKDSTSSRPSSTTKPSRPCSGI